MSCILGAGAGAEKSDFPKCRGLGALMRGTEDRTVCFHQTRLPRTRAVVFSVSLPTYIYIHTYTHICTHICTSQAAEGGAAQSHSEKRALRFS